MNTVVNLHPQEFSDLLKSQAIQITDSDGDTYFHIPFWYKEKGNNNFEILRTENLPREVKDIINPCQL